MAQLFPASPESVQPVTLILLYPDIYGNLCVTNAMITIREYLDPKGRSPFAKWFASLNAPAAASPHFSRAFHCGGGSEYVYSGCTLHVER